MTFHGTDGPAVFGPEFLKKNLPPLGRRLPFSQKQKQEQPGSLSLDQPAHAPKKAFRAFALALADFCFDVRVDNHLYLLLRCLVVSGRSLTHLLLLSLCVASGLSGWA